MSTKSHNISLPPPAHTRSGRSTAAVRTVASTECGNGRIVRVLECRNPSTNEFYSYDVTVTKTNGDMDVAWSGPLVGEALQSHFRLVTKFGGVAKPKTPEEKEAEKHKVLDELISALDSPSVEFGREQGAIADKKSKNVTLGEDYRNRGLAENIRPRKTDFNILDLDYANSAVDVMKALGWDYTVAGRQSVAMSLGYRGKLDKDDRAPMNDWLVKEINRRFGYEIRDRVEKARKKARGPVFTELDWDAHMEELDAKVQVKPSPKKSKEPCDNMDYLAETKAAEKPLKDKPKTKKSVLRRRILDLATDHLCEIDDWTAEEMSTAELEDELTEFFRSTYGDDWHLIGEDEVTIYLDESWV